MAFVDLNSTALDTSPPPQGQFVDLGSMQLDAQPPSGGLFSNISNDISQAGIDKDNLDSLQKSGQISIPENAFRTMGRTGQEVSSVVGDVAKSIYDNGTTDLGKKLVNAAIQPVKDAANSFVNYADNTDIGKAYNGYMSDNPRVAAMINAVPGVASLIAPAAGAESTTGSAMADALKASSTPNITQLQARALGGNLYQKANDLGAVASPSFTDNKILGAIDSQAPKTDAGTIGRATDPFTLWAQDAKSTLAGKPLSLTALQELDGNLGDQIDKYTDRTTGFPTAEATPFIKVQQALRNATKPTNLSSSDLVSGTPEALQAWKDGQGVWADSYKIGDIERINRRADFATGNPSQVLQSGYRRIATSDNFRNLYTPEQQNLIERAATKGLAVRGLELAGSGVAPMIGSIMGGAHAGVEGMGAGGMIGLGAGVPFRAMAKSLQSVPGKALQENLSAGVLRKFPDYTPPVPESPSSPPTRQILALPPPSITVDSVGRAKTAEQAAYQRTMGTPSGTWAARMAARNTTAPVFDALEGQPEIPQNAVASKAPVSQAISEAGLRAQILAKETGIEPNNPQMRAALLKALLNKGSQ